MVRCCEKQSENKAWRGLWFTLMNKAGRPWQQEPGKKMPDLALGQRSCVFS